MRPPIRQFLKECAHSLLRALDEQEISGPAQTEASFHTTPVQANDRLAEGVALVEAIRKRGEEVRLDLGCGFRKNGNIGIDITKEGTMADLECAIGFEPLPLPDGSIDAIFCRDFLEHLPKAYYSESARKLRYPVIDLFNEIWRVLKPGGTFTSYTPAFPHVEVHRDPTHLSVWTLESMDYFCGKYIVAKTYGLKATFELVQNRMEKFYLFAVLRKPTS